MKIYTKTGDSGETGLIGGERVGKDSLRISAIGEVDELNALIGVVRAIDASFPLDGLLEKIQGWLFEAGAEFASPNESRFATVGQSAIDALEASIDEQERDLPELKNFILPGGNLLAAHLHLARSVCRRVERTSLCLHREEPVRYELRVFFNRFADWLFIGARTANHLSNVEEVNWKRGL